MKATDTTKAVAYYRVSTKKQGLGLDAQRAIVEQWAASKGIEIVAEFSEKESGCETEREGILQAIKSCHKHNAMLVAAKADRLSRDLEFAAKLFYKMDITVRALNMPEEVADNPMLLGVYFGLAAQEAKLISERTKQALAALKAKGVKLGRPNAEVTAEMREKAAEARKDAANRDPRNLAAADELRRYWRGAEKRNLSAAARHLNDMMLYTPKNREQTAWSVSLLVQRYGI